MAVARDLGTFSPFGYYEWVDITFTTADTDVVAVYTELQPQDPDLVRFLVVSNTTGGVVYRDGSASATPWTQGMVKLRCSAANAVVRVLLFVEAAHV